MKVSQSSDVALFPIPDFRKGATAPLNLILIIKEHRSWRVLIFPILLQGRQISNYPPQFTRHSSPVVWAEV